MLLEGKTNRYFAILLSLLIVLNLSATVVATPQSISDTQDGETLTVGTQDGAEYRSIQAALDNASAGDTVRILPGDYIEQVTVKKNVTIDAPNGAKLIGEAGDSESVGLTIPEGSAVAPTVRNLTIVGFDQGIVAKRTTGAWTLINVTVADSREDGLSADETSGAWRVEDSVIQNNGDEGIDAEKTTRGWTIQNTTIQQNGDDGIDADGRDATGSWLIENSTLRNNAGQGIDVENTTSDWTIRSTNITGNQHGVQAPSSHGDWTIEDSSISGNDQTGINVIRSQGNWSVKGTLISHNEIAGIVAEETAGKWVVKDSTIQNTSVGIFTPLSTGAWRVQNTVFRNIMTIEFDFVGEATGIHATDTSGSWDIKDSSFEQIDRYGINATGAAPAGDATGNWWKSQNDSKTHCVGNVSCGDSRSSPSNSSSDANQTRQGATTSPSSSSTPGFQWATTVCAIVLFVLAISYRKH